MKIHPKAVAEHRDLVLTCLDDEDVSIRQRALDLLSGMVCYFFVCLLFIMKRYPRKTLGKL